MQVREIGEGGEPFTCRVCVNGWRDEGQQREKELQKDKQLWRAFFAYVLKGYGIYKKNIYVDIYIGI